MKKRCYWTHPPYQPCAPLTKNIQTSYLIVGGGISGLFVAHYLLKNGVKNITLIEKKRSVPVQRDMQQACWSAPSKPLSKTSSTKKVRRLLLTT